MRLLTVTRVALVLVISVLLATMGGCSKAGKSKSTASQTDSQQVASSPWNYPPAATVDQVDEYHGTQVADPYRWLEDVDSEQTKAWVQAQNEITFTYLADIPARESLRERLTEVWDYPRYSTPIREGERLFFSKNDGLQNQAVLYVQDTPHADPRVLLDPNSLSADGTISLGSTSISDDGEYLAWSTSVSGSDWRTWFVREVATARDLDGTIQWSKFSDAAWSHDNLGFYYSRYEAPAQDNTYEEANYFQKLYYHRVGTDQAEDELVYERPDQKEWGFNAAVSDDGRFLIIHVWRGSSDKNAIFYKDLQDPGASVVEFLNGFDANYHFIGNDGSVMYMETSLDAPRHRIVAVDINNPASENWQTLVPEQQDTLQRATMLNDQFLLIYLHDAHSQIQVWDRVGTLADHIELPSLGSVSGFHGNRTDDQTYFMFTSFLNPAEIYHYDFTTQESSLYWEPTIDFDFSAYTTEQVFILSKDGTQVPMFLVHRHDITLDGSHPTILYGYGGFNISLVPRFRTGLLPWLELGGIWASANLRGGGEYGEEWHQDGMLKNKQNVFDDFIAAAEYLIAEGYTSTPKLAIQGASNGGLLVGACLNQRPDLFGAALPDVGVMDMLRYQNFTIGWAWVPDYGSSENPEMFPTLYAYSPYHNLAPDTVYPAVLVTTADHDDRVVPGHSFKYAARLQVVQSGDAPTLIRIQTKSGHGGGKPTSMVIQEYADRYAFLTQILDMQVE